MELQTRDLNLLTALDRFGILSSKQIENLFFERTHFTVVMRRLRILEKENLILRIDSLPSKMLAWSLSKKGAMAIQKVPQPRHTNRNTTLHDVTLSGVRIALEKIGMGKDFINELEIRRMDGIQNKGKRDTATQNPDGFFVDQMKPDCLDKVITLEVEVNPKSHARYAKILRYYMTRFDVSVVWYLVSKKGIIKPILHQWKRAERYQASPDIYFTEVDDLIAKGSSAEIKIASSKDDRFYQAMIRDRFFVKENAREKAEKGMPENADELGRQQISELGKMSA